MSTTDDTFQVGILSVNTCMSTRYVYVLCMRVHVTFLFVHANLHFYDVQDANKSVVSHMLLIIFLYSDLRA